jgi:hypothetical protein
MFSPKYFAVFTVARGTPWMVLNVEMSGFRLFVILRTSHLSALKPHEPAVLPLLQYIQVVLYLICSSANSLVVDVTDSGKSLMYRRNRSGPRTVPWGTPDVTGDLPDFIPSHTTSWVLYWRKLAIH